MPAPVPHPDEREQFLSFFLAGEEYAVEILRIREVVEYQRLTKVPTAPAWVRGVMNLRGTIVPVLDLASKFGHGATTVERRTCIVIFEVELEGEATSVGVLIDAVGRVLELGAADIQPAPAFGSPIRPELLQGLGVLDDQPIAILDIQRVLTEEELAAAVEGAAEAEAGGVAAAPETEAAAEPAAPSRRDRGARPKAGAEDPSPAAGAPAVEAGAEAAAPTEAPESGAKPKRKSRGKGKPRRGGKARSQAGPRSKGATKAKSSAPDAGAPATDPGEGDGGKTVAPASGPAEAPSAAETRPGAEPGD